MTDYLVLVNSEHPFEKAFLDSLSLISIINCRGQETLIEKCTYESAVRLIERLKDEGLCFGIGGVFRTVEYQTQLMEKFTGEKGPEYAKKYVAVPGQSEHHTGLAIDLLPFIDGSFHGDHETLFNAAEMFSKLHVLLHEYGFILRYPKGKEEITKISYEPWHIRYVGEVPASEMHDNNLCLEEYVKLKGII